MIRRIRADEAHRLREIRLRALADAPTAFGSTLAREEMFPDAVWHERAAGGAAGPDRATFVAEENDRWGGLATGVAHHPEGPDHSPMLIGMFVDSTQRGRGVGAALVEQVLGWAHAPGPAPLPLGDLHQPARDCALRAVRLQAHGGITPPSSTRRRCVRS